VYECAEENFSLCSTHAVIVTWSLGHFLRHPVFWRIIQLICYWYSLWVYSKTCLEDKSEDY